MRVIKKGANGTPWYIYQLIEYLIPTNTTQTNQYYFNLLTVEEASQWYPMHLKYHKVWLNAKPLVNQRRFN
jgi:hypothetical protein